MISAAAYLLSCVWAAGLAPAQLAPVHPMQDEIDRLIGQEVKTSATSYELLSVAGEGVPFVGCVRKRDGRLFLATDRALYPLAGPLAIARIAGPNYKVWIIGDVDAEQQLFARRIGILAGPARAQCPVRRLVPNEFGAQPPNACRASVGVSRLRRCGLAFHTRD